MKGVSESVLKHFLTRVNTDFTVQLQLTIFIGMLLAENARLKNKEAKETVSYFLRIPLARHMLAHYKGFLFKYRKVGAMIRYLA